MHKLHRRSKLEIRADLLRVINEAEGGQTIATHMMYHANLSWRLMMRELPFLVLKGLIDVTQKKPRVAYQGWGADARSTERTEPEGAVAKSKIFKLSPRGLSTLKAYEQLRNDLKGEKNE